ncbi:MAG: GntR family transcriptional regulator [Solirubrobacteraceae bacterium]
MASTTRQPRADAYDMLRAEIMGGRLSPNERLVEYDLVDRYGLSRAAVRMALVRLEQDRVVVREPNRGARVRRVTEAEAVEILETRAALEGVAAGHAARRATDDEIAQLLRIADEMVALHGRGDLLAMSEANAQLHRLILQASRHATVQRIAAGLKSQMVRFQYRTILVTGRASYSLAEHAAIVNAIAARDPEVAERAMRLHLFNVARALHEGAERAAARGAEEAGA